ncbi:ImmA/IrrE family metallo-endopeptidase [Thioalkalivibrio halophilus]|uniref:IrrE N-terminal-like domain-containing protein n=1 Tax=Thioalkalivibrio halophilus TaxID=252474 RepID=A0A1V2ZWV4_9GAMM|nr:ImmA/IrrE family metallo-endopeptidase [Thioalkalivibrio halophilus]OOC09604.1 hypothetical protein B1A74_10055 [Thioalkalivibrio halophilus]
MMFGYAGGLQIELDLEPASLEGLAEGRCRMFLAGEPVWVGEGEAPDGCGGYLEWTWVDMLEFLGRWWPWLVLEEDYPVPVSPAFPSQFLAECERRWDGMADEQVDDEELEAHRFLARHDLASAPRGLFLPSLIIMRQGKTAQISAPGLPREVIRPWREVETVLEAAGEHLSTACAESTQPRARQAVGWWQERRERTEAREWMLTTRLEEDAPGRFEQAGIDADEWQWPELRAVARMAFDSVVNADQQAELLRRIVDCPARATPELDRIEAALGEQLDDTEPPYRQGYWAASWLREWLSLSPEAAVEPGEWLKRWGVHVEGINLGACPIEAVTVWGERHGPLVLVNHASESRAGHEYGERATLAHEIAHLLLDRQGALPVAEVLGGRTPEYPEKRARAFAAELLLPRDVAARAVEQSADLTEAAERLRADYRVSRELLAWQITNSGAAKQLQSRQEKALLEQWRSGRAGVT